MGGSVAMSRRMGGAVARVGVWSSTTRTLGERVARTRLRIFGCDAELTINGTRGSTLANLVWKPQCGALGGGAQRLSVRAKLTNPELYLCWLPTKFEQRFGGDAARLVRAEIVK